MTRTTLELDRLDRGGQRQESMAFELVDLYGGNVGWLNPTRGLPRITNDATRTIPRTLDGLFVPWDQAADIDVIGYRLRPWWVRENGTREPLGEFAFANAPTQIHSRGGDLVCALTDLSGDLDQPDAGVFGCSTGRDVSDCIRDEWERVGTREYSVDASGVFLGAPLGWPTGTTPRKRMLDLSVLAGFLPPYYDNTGVGISRTAPDLSAIVPSISYGTRDDEYPILRDSITEDSDRLKAPNRWIVVSTSAGAAPIVGQYDLPDWVPWSYANRGRIVCAPVIRSQGIPDTATANAMARSAAVSDRSLSRIVTFSSPVVPTHDTWTTVGYGGAAWLERSWTIEGKAGGAMQHVVRRSLVE